jgi:hypothetical protein
VVLAWVLLQLSPGRGTTASTYTRWLQALGHAIGHGRAQHAGIGVHGQHHIAHLFCLDGVDAHH